MTVVEYKVIEQYTPFNLQQEVSGLISQGWQPHGSLTVLIDRDSPVFYQPMVRCVDRPGEVG